MLTAARNELEVSRGSARPGSLFVCSFMCPMMYLWPSCYKFIRSLWVKLDGACSPSGHFVIPCTASLLHASCIHFNNKTECSAPHLRRYCKRCGCKTVKPICV